MWDSVQKYLTQFETTVLVAFDTDDRPFNVRCGYRLDSEAQRIELDLPAGALLTPGRASLTCHSHNEDLWDLKAVMIRGDLMQSKTGQWALVPSHIVPTGGLKGGLNSFITLWNARKVAQRYLDRRGISRPEIPWAEIKRLREEAKR